MAGDFGNQDFPVGHVDGGGEEGEGGRGEQFLRLQTTSRLQLAHFRDGVWACG